MAGKSKRKKKYSQYSKRSKGRQHQMAAVARQATQEQGVETVPVSGEATQPKVDSPLAVKKPFRQHPFIISELRTIGILAGVMLAILVILYFILS